MDSDIVVADDMRHLVEYYGKMGESALMAIAHDQQPGEG